METLVNPNTPISSRLRALFLLRMTMQPGCDQCLSGFSKAFNNTDSVLLKHEIAFSLGQMKHPAALPFLYTWMNDETQHVVTRHEAGEAIGAIGQISSKPELEKFANSTLPELRDTVHLALKRIDWLAQGNVLPQSKFISVDPAPPAPSSSVEELSAQLMNYSIDLFERYTAMFALRNIGTEQAVQALCEGLKDTQSTLFRHEVAYVLGQMENPVAIQALVEAMKNMKEAPIVRHEAAYSLGAIGTECCIKHLEEFKADPELIVSDSCVVGIDVIGDSFKATNVFVDPSAPVASRMRALHVLRQSINVVYGSEKCLSIFTKGFNNTTSVLLKHEIAFTLGQMKHPAALPLLYTWMNDETQHIVTRHEAAEAIGAIGQISSKPELEKYVDSPLTVPLELRDTVHLALKRIDWLAQGNVFPQSKYLSVDPAPPAKSTSVEELRAQLMNYTIDLFDRFGAMFALRNIGTEQAAQALCEGLKDTQSALFRHEVAYVLGQLGYESSVTALAETLRNNNEHPMVRHESAYSIGGIGSKIGIKHLEDEKTDPEPLVSDSCLLGLELITSK